MLNGLLHTYVQPEHMKGQSMSRYGQMLMAGNNRFVAHINLDTVFRCKSQFNTGVNWSSVAPFNINVTFPVSALNRDLHLMLSLIKPTQTWEDKGGKPVGLLIWSTPPGALS